MSTDTPAPAHVSAARIEAALGNPTPRPVPDSFHTAASTQSVPVKLKGACDARYPSLSALVVVGIGTEELVTLAFSPDQAEALAAALIAHAKYTRTGAAWLATEACK